MEATNTDHEQWKRASSQVFWGEIAPCEHVVQIYENDEVFLDLLSGFIHAGLEAGDAVVVIATAAHLDSVAERLRSLGYTAADAVASGRYFPVEAEAMLSRFMVFDWPDENLFNHAVSEVINKASANGRRVRAFGEMVALLWAKGQVGATIRLEHLWDKFCETQTFCLFCAYPKSGFTQDATESIMHIRGAHSKMITGVRQRKAELFYKSIRA